MQTFEQLLDYRVLTASYRDTPAIGDFHFSNKYFTNVRDVPTDEWELINFGPANQPLPINSRGASANTMTPQGGTKRIGNMFVGYDRTPLDVTVLQALREEESFALQQKGAATVAAVQEEFIQRARVRKEAIIASIMAYGQVGFDANGNVIIPTVDSLSGTLTAGSGAVITADFTVADGHRGNLTSAGTAISNMWSNSDAKIVDQLEQIRYNASVAGVPRPTEITVNELSKKHLRDNAQFKEWAKESNVAPDTILRGEMIQGLWGFDWHFVGGTYTDVNGTTVDLVPQTHAIIAPPVGPWLRAVNGLTLVPTSLDTQTDVGAALAALTDVYGEYSYAKLDHNPATLYLYGGDAFGMAFANPNSVWMPNVFETDDGSSQSGTG